MINRTCDICEEYVESVWTVAIKDDKETKEYSGHFKCVSELQNHINSIKNLDKKSVQQVLKEISKYIRSEQHE